MTRGPPVYPARPPEPPCRDGDDGAHGDAPGGELVVGELHLPHVAVGLGLDRDDLHAVDDAAAAHGEDEVDAPLARQAHPLLDLGVGGVGHDAGELDHVLVGLREQPHDRIVDAVALDGPAAVGEHDGLADLGELRGQRALEGALAEMHRGGIAEIEALHDASLVSVSVHVHDIRAPARAEVFICWGPITPRFIGPAIGRYGHRIGGEMR